MICAIPRHQIETTGGEYARAAIALGSVRTRAREVERFESTFAAYVGCRHAIAVASGRLGLRLVLKHLAIEPGGEAIIPAFNYFAVVEQFLDLGIEPLFADIRCEDLNLDAGRIESLVTARTRVILATHMFGHPCDMDALTEMAQQHNLVLIEDCAHALGSLHRGRHVGTFGRAGVFSLSPMKLITTFGGGMITTDDDQLAGLIRDDLACNGRAPGRTSALRRFAKGTMLDFGTRTGPFTLAVWPALRLARAVCPDIQQRMMTEVPRRLTECHCSGSSAAPGTTAPGAVQHPIELLDTFQARLGVSQIRRAHELIRRRRRVSEWLDSELSCIDSVTLLRTCNQGFQNGMYYGILVDQPGSLSHYLFSRGIDSETSEYCNCADLEIYRSYRRECPMAASVGRRILRIPNHPRLSHNDVKRIAHAIRLSAIPS